MKNERLNNLNIKLKGLAKEALYRGKKIAKISIAEDRKTMRVAAFWVLTVIMCLIAIGSTIYENVILPDRVNYDSYDSEFYYVQDEWIETVKADKAKAEKSLADSNMKKTSKESLRATIKDKEKQIELLEYLKANNVPLRLKDIESPDADYVYYIEGIAYRFDEISFSVSSGGVSPEPSLELGGPSYMILSDERSGDSVFEANLIFYFVAVLLVVLAFSDEFSTGTIKLIISKPVTRRDIGLSKLFSISTLLTLSWTMSAVLYTLMSLFFKNPVKYVAYIGGAFSTISTMGFTLLTFVDILFVSLGFIAVSMFFAVRFKNNIVAVILPFIVYFFANIFVRVVPNLAVIDLFENLKLMEHFVLGDTVYGSTAVWKALLSSCGIMLVLMMFGIRRFKRYDMDKLK